MDFLFPLLIIFMIGMIFFSNRQRKKQQNQQESLQNSIVVGDVVVMTCGVSGTVVDTDDEKTIDLEIAPEVITTWLRAAVREKLSTDADTAFADGPEGHEELPGDVPEHSTTATASEAPTVSTPEPKDSPRASASEADGGFSDPTAAPSSNGVSAGSSTPGDTRPPS
ncbi:preprotein translocase subunit YajC [Actinomycetospora endophytica]|uniref:Preprotein translocase subunit YajC n=1 Tax=Actinomycetospora endophytica TaxID=2291215 RepID=A0ABS8PB59_9PSEU|nr:preprotein translocase subunit YajC [Actinomycetospora endophytica]MCD2195497.1 preprotein translocase subunit YajC [Actinomycetospora endophytica]